MTRRTLEHSHTFREVHAALQHNPGLRAMRNCGRHTVYTGPHGCVPVPTHQGDVPRGTLKSIVKMAVMAGLAVVIILIML